MESTAIGNTASFSGTPNNPEGALSKASSTVHAVVDSIAEAADVAARKARPAIDRVAAKAHQAVDKATGVAEPTAEWLAGQGERLKSTQQKLVSDTCSYISAHPLTAVGFALAAGFLLSRIIR